MFVTPVFFHLLFLSLSLRQVPVVETNEAERIGDILATGRSGLDNHSQALDEQPGSNLNHSGIQTKHCGDNDVLPNFSAFGSSASDLLTQSSTGNEATSGAKVRKKKVRKDKSALRKSSLNMASHPPEEGKKLRMKTALPLTIPLFRAFFL